MASKVTHPERHASGERQPKTAGATYASDLAARLHELLENIETIRRGEVDSLILGESGREQVYSITSPDRTYQLLVTAMNEGAAIVSARGTILDANPRLAAMAARQKGEIIGQPILDLVPRTERRAVARLLTVRASESARGEIQLARPDGTTTPALLAVSGFDLDGMFVRCLILTDLTEIKALDIELQTSLRHLRAEQRYVRTLFEANMDALVTTDTAGKITDVNPAMEAFTGKPRSALVGASLADLAKNPRRLTQSLRRALREGHASDLELRISQADGTETILSCNAATFTGSDGHPEGILASARDVTERAMYLTAQQRVLNQARKLDQTRNDLISRISHELRRPLTGIVGYLELLQAGRGGSLSSEQQRITGLIEDDTARLRAQIEELLTMSRLEARKIPIHWQVVDLGSLVRQACDEARPMMALKGLRLRLDIRPGTVIEGDTQELTLIVSNLLSNSVKFTPSGGRIYITVRLDSNASAAVLRVRDTGIGIPPDELPRLFTRFFRSSESETKQIAGTGLGLFIVKQVAEAHGGTVSASSTLGKGSVFTIRLPIHRPAANPSPKTRAPSTGTGTRVSSKKRNSSSAVPAREQIR